MASLTWGSESITGNFRDNNEDRCLTDPQGRFFFVCDGLGGQAAGERASQMGIEEVAKKLNQSLDFATANLEQVRTCIDAAVNQANSEIMAMASVDASMHNMGSTIVMLVAAGGKLYVTNVGDSRAYQITSDQIIQLTRDHSVTQALLEAGTITAADAEHHRWRNVLLRYLGTKDGSQPCDVRELEPRAGDIYVLCSDGVLDGLDDPEIAAIARAEPNPEVAAKAIVAAALEGGSKDNITCVVVRVQ